MPGNGGIQIWMIGMPNHDMSRSLDDLEAIGAVETPKVVLPPPEARSPHALQEFLAFGHTLNLP
jgi:hypothetical protein